MVVCIKWVDNGNVELRNTCYCEVHDEEPHSLLSAGTPHYYQDWQISDNIRCKKDYKYNSTDLLELEEI